MYMHVADVFKVGDLFYLKFGQENDKYSSLKLTQLKMLCLIDYMSSYSTVSSPL